MAVSDRTLIAGALLAGAVALFARSSFAGAGGGARWSEEEIAEMNRRLGAKGISAIMLTSFASASTPDALVESVRRSNGLQGVAEVTAQLLTHVFSFMDRAGELYRAALTSSGARQWVRDRGLEAELSAK